MLSMSNQVSLPKISLILQKMKIGQNSIYALFAQSPSILVAQFTMSSLSSFALHKNVNIFRTKTDMPKRTVPFCCIF